MALGVLQALGEDPQRKHLDASHGLVPSGSVGQNARQLRYLRKPPAIGLALTLDVEIHHRYLRFHPILRPTLW